MGIIKAFTDAVTSSIADQWKEIITAGPFDEHTLVAPGVLKTRNLGRGTNDPGSEGIISNGSMVFVPEQTAAFIFNQASIESIIQHPGKYVYLDGDESVFNGDGIISPITKQIKRRFGFGGITPDNKKIAFVNLREIRDIRYGTPGALVYHDPAYGVDLEIHAWGSFSIKIIESDVFIKNFVPPNVLNYSVDDKSVRNQIISEFLQSFSVALNTMSGKYRVSQIQAHENEISDFIANDSDNAGTWRERFGFQLVRVAIRNIELSDASKQLLGKYASAKVELSALNDISNKTSNIAAQQKIAQGIRDHGLGNMGGMVFGMNLTKNLGINADIGGISIEQQLDIITKLHDAKVAGIISEEEFSAKKREILGL